MRGIGGVVEILSEAFQSDLMVERTALGRCCGSKATSAPHGEAAVHGYYVNPTPNNHWKSVRAAAHRV